MRCAQGTLILGIDPGLHITGYGVLQIAPAGPKLIEAGVVRGPARGPLPQRLMEIFRGVQEVLQGIRPHVMAVESLYSHYDHPRTAILMGHARGVIFLAGADAEIPVFAYAATQIKKVLTGNGRAPKSQMQQAVCRELGLVAPPEPPDVADALAIALCHHYLGGKEEAA